MIGDNSGGASGSYNFPLDASDPAQVVNAGGGNPFDQELNTTDSPTFASITVGGDVTLNGGVIYDASNNPGTEGQVLTSHGTSSPTWSDPTAANPFDQNLNSTDNPAFSALTVAGKSVVKTDSDSVGTSNIPVFIDTTGNLLADSGISFPLDARNGLHIVNGSLRGEITSGYYYAGQIVTESVLTAICIADVSVGDSSNYPSSDSTHWFVISPIPRTPTILVGDSTYGRVTDSGYSFPLDGSDPAQITNVASYDQDLNTTDTPTFAGLIVGSNTYPASLGSAGQVVGSNGAGVTWLDFPNVPSIAETTNILVGDDNGNAADSGYAFPLDASDPAQVINAGGGRPSGLTFRYTVAATDTAPAEPNPGEIVITSSGELIQQLSGTDADGNDVYALLDGIIDTYTVLVTGDGGKLCWWQLSAPSHNDTWFGFAGGTPYITPTSGYANGESVYVSFVPFPVASSAYYDTGTTNGTIPLVGSGNKLDPAIVPNIFNQTLNTGDDPTFNSLSVGTDGINIDGVNIITQDSTATYLDPLDDDKAIKIFNRRSGSIIFGSGGGVATINQDGVMSGFSTVAVDGAGIYNMPLGAISSGDFLQRMVDDAAVGDGEYKIVVTAGVASLVAI